MKYFYKVIFLKVAPFRFLFQTLPDSCNSLRKLIFQPNAFSPLFTASLRIPSSGFWPNLFVLDLPQNGTTKKGEKGSDCFAGDIISNLKHMLENDCWPFVTSQTVNCQALSGASQTGKAWIFGSDLQQKRQSETQMKGARSLHSAVSYCSFPLRLFSPSPPFLPSPPPPGVLVIKFSTGARRRQHVANIGDGDRLQVNTRRSCHSSGPPPPPISLPLEIFNLAVASVLYFL